MSEGVWYPHAVLYALLSTYIHIHRRRHVPCRTDVVFRTWKYLMMCYELRARCSSGFVTCDFRIEELYVLGENIHLFRTDCEALSSLRCFNPWDLFCLFTYNRHSKTWVLLQGFGNIFSNQRINDVKMFPGYYPLSEIEKAFLMSDATYKTLLT
jgi:hypothetical protein